MKSNVWNMDLSPGKHKRSWWWWFWLFFMENTKNPKHPLQMAIIWSTKDCDRFRINDIWWERKKGIQKKGNKIEFAGALGAWFYDGRRMIEPVILDKRDFEIENNDGSGSLVSMEDDHYLFKGGPGGYHVGLEKKGFKIDVDLTSTNDPLSENKYSQNSFYFGYGYDILKIRRMNLEGTVKIGNKEEDIKGTGYFQKVRISAPIIPPWYWGTIHANDGSYLQYYLLHLGPPMFRRKNSQSSPWDWGEKYISKSISFYSKELERPFEFKHPTITKHFTKGGLPVFKMEGENNGYRISYTLKSYSRAKWYFEQPMMGLMKTLLYYNEYPVTLSKFLLEGRGIRITERNLKGGVGNCEHAWGCLI